jgi:hypothetical protein
VQKLLLVSILLATMVLPMRAARDPSAVRGLRKALLWIVGFDVCYMLALLHLYPRLF